MITAALDATQAQTIPQGTVLLTPIPPPLSAVATPRPSLTGIVNPGMEPNLVALGKALFWDQQVGGDGVMACASCHFHAGADHRRKNQVNWGKNGKWDTVTGPGQTQTANMFPFGWKTNTPSTDDVMGSQGTNSGDFRKVTNKPVDQTSNVTGHRQVTGRNSPSNINAVFNFRNFWDGRAAETFNGVTPFGAMDQNAQLIVNNGGAFGTEKIKLPFASLASQAVGPANNDVEMSFRGRDWADLGFKMLSRKPLAFQQVAAGNISGDSILGPVANTVSSGGKPPMGLTYTNYEQMMTGIFNTKYTSAPFMLCYSDATGFTMKGKANCPVGKSAGYRIAEANFSLFFGLAVQAYQQQLISGQTRFDQWASTGSQTGTGTGLTTQEFNGMLTFYGPRAQCGVCHFGPEFTSASVSFINLLQAGGAAAGGGIFPVANLNTGFFDPNNLLTAPHPRPANGPLQANPACAGGTCTYSTAGAANGTTYPQANVLGPDGRFVGPYERMIMAYRKDSTGQTMPINLFNIFNLPAAQNPLSQQNLPAGVTLPAGATGAPDGNFTALGTSPVNQTTQSPFALYDLGFYNIGPRPTSDDPGVGGVMPSAVTGSSPFFPAIYKPSTATPPTALNSQIPLSLTRRMKANQASLSKQGIEDRDYWLTPSSFSAFPFNTCVVQENQVINPCALPGAGPNCIANPVPGVTAFPSNPNLIDAQACNFFAPAAANGEGNGGGAVVNGAYQAILDPLTLQPLVGGRLLNGADYQKDQSGLAAPDRTCLTTTVYGPTGSNLQVTPSNGQCPEERDAVDAAFKTPGLRNVEFTGPYFHNGSAKTLEEVVDFYATGGHHVNMELSPEILAIPANNLTADEKANIVAFLKALSDDRVAFQKAPFDHPSLCLAESNAAGNDEYKLLPVVGRGGAGTKLETFAQMLASADTRQTCKPF